MENIALGIAQIHFYEMLKENKDFDIEDTYTLCEVINDLYNKLVQYGDESNSALRQSITETGQDIFNMGNTNLMIEVGAYMCVINLQVSGVLDTLWHGIGDWKT